MSLNTLEIASLHAGRYRIASAPDAGRRHALYLAAHADDAAVATPLLLLVIDAEISVDRAWQGRLRHELRDRGRVDGHVTTLLDCGIEESPPQGSPGAWVIFEAPWGDSLSRALSVGPLDPDEAREALWSLCHSLKALHLAGRWHGAVSPWWIWYGRPDRGPAVVTLIAPGIAPLIVHAVPELRAHEPTPLSPDEVAWCSPEALLGEPVGASADVWGLALIAFELLTGARYWKPPTKPDAWLGELITQVMGERAPPGVRAEKCPRPGALPIGFETWFLGCTARKPEDRPAMAQAVDALLQMLAKPPGPEFPLDVGVLAGNPKGSFYDGGLATAGQVDDRSGYRGSKPERRPEIVLGNPKGSFYDGGLNRGGPRRAVVAMSILGLIGAAIAWFLSTR